MTSKYILVLLIGGIFLSAGCKEKVTESDVSVKFNFRYDSEELAYNQEYTYDTDKKIKFELVKFYVSKPAFINDNEVSFPFPEEYFLIDLDHRVIAAGKLPVGYYNSLQFGIGVDNSRNIQTDPLAIPATDYPTDHPLNFAADMYWGWSSGYIFAKIEGRIDANNNGLYTDSVDKAISYHPGVSQLYRSVNIQKTFEIKEGISQQEITLDMVKLIDGVKFLQNPVAHPNGTAGPEYVYALPLMDNFITAFE